MLRLPKLYGFIAVFPALLAGCHALPPIDDENCGKMMATRNNYLQCLAQKEVGACEHLLRLYQADAQVFAASGCARSSSGAKRLMQSPSW
jgi:hypothetical protein